MRGDRYTKKAEMNCNTCGERKENKLLTGISELGGERSLVTSKRTWLTEARK